MKKFQYGIDMVDDTRARVVKINQGMVTIASPIMPKDKAMAISEWNSIKSNGSASHLGITKAEFMREFPKELAEVRKHKFLPR